MASAGGSILTINGGSSSIKFALYRVNGVLELLLSGEIGGIGKKDTQLKFNTTNTKDSLKIKAADHDEAVKSLIDWLQKQDDFSKITAIGHRIVHGMQHTEPEKITPELIKELKSISAYDPEHLPDEIKLIEVFTKQMPSVEQVACFDTAFHTSMPIVARQLAIPRRFYDKGIQRYGFHGLSYTYLMDQLKEMKSADGKIILAHLGSGASLAAVKDGKSIDTSMGFTPAAGIPMSTRTGDIDPGVAWYLMKTEKLSPKEFSHLVNHESGLLGVSETSADMSDLLKIKHKDSRAAEAVELFCYQTKKWIGSFSAALGGLDTLVFSGGIGEHAPEIRALICDGLQFLGIELDKKKNDANEAIVSKKDSKVIVHVIKTNEELIITKLVCQVLNYKITI